MSSAQHRANRPKFTTFQLVAGLSLIIGLAAGSLALVILFDAAPESTERSVSNAPMSTTPTSTPSEQAFLAGTEEAPDSTATETPEATRATSPEVATAEPEPTPETDNAAFADSPVATATATPEAQRASSADQQAAESGGSDPVDSSAAGSSASSMQLKIPSIGVDAPVQVKSVDSEGVMEDPSSPDAVAWYDFTSRPEDGGNAVFAGHLDYAGVGPAVFWELGSVSKGDEVEVTQPNGSVVRYRITSVRSVHADADASDIVASSDVAKITIITCGGSFDPANQEYDQRIIVTGGRVG